MYLQQNAKIWSQYPCNALKTLRFIQSTKYKILKETKNKNGKVTTLVVHIESRAYGVFGRHYFRDKGLCEKEKTRIGKPLKDAVTKKRQAKLSVRLIPERLKPFVTVVLAA